MKKDKELYWEMREMIEGQEKELQVLKDKLLDLPVIKFCPKCQRDVAAKNGWGNVNHGNMINIYTIYKGDLGDPVYQCLSCGTKFTVERQDVSKEIKV